MNVPLSPGFCVHRGLDALPERLVRGTLAIGNFDGVHAGHKAVIARTREIALDTNTEAVALTFEPHPRTFFRPDLPVPRLTLAREKRLLLAREGLDGVVELTFDAALASLTAEEFVTRILVEKLQVVHVVVGHDFHFGKNRGGSPAFLQDAGKRHGFAVSIVDAFGAEGGAVVSSSLIREALREGRVVEANRLLGHRWFVMGEVVHGDKRGRTLGYPTANIALPPETPLAHGIYAVRVSVDGETHDGVASFGRRPTFAENGAELLETYIFDFSRDLYGKTIAVEIVGFLRGEEKFDSAEALIEQMHRDAVAAMEILAAPMDPLALSAIG